jgi:hypothetical protein
MSINTEDREAVRRQREVVIRKTPDGQWYATCSHCLFWREWATEIGAVNAMAAHLMNVHHVRLVLPTRKP